MQEIINNSLFLGAALSLIAYEIGLLMKHKWKLAIFNPTLISVIAIIGELNIFKIDYDVMVVVESYIGI